MGAIADYTQLKKTFMAFFCYLGVIACCLLFFVQGNLYVLGCALFIVANLGAGASVVFYNSFLVDITTEDRRDKVSSRSSADISSRFGILLKFKVQDLKIETH